MTATIAKPYIEKEKPLPAFAETVKLDILKDEFRKYLTPAMVYASRGHKKCHGRGRLGVNIITGANIPCSCLVVDTAQLRAAIKAEIDRLTPAPETPAGEVHASS